MKTGHPHIVAILSFFLFIVCLSPLFAQTSVSTIREKSLSGKTYTIVTLENEYLSARMIPELGIKIISIFHKKLNREFVDRSAIPYEWRKYDMPFTDMERDGFDECFPSISRVPYPAGVWQGTVIPDHGEICQVPGRYQEIYGSIITTTSGVRFPYTFRRKLSLDRETLVMDYTVSNCSSEPFYYVYATHPLFRLESGGRMELPPGAEVIDSSGKIEGWQMRLNPATKRMEDRSIMQPPSVNQMVKLFAKGLKEGWAVMHFPKGESLRIDFPVDKLPYMGIWITEGGWYNSYQFAFEPTNAITDAVSEAYKNGSAVLLQPFGSNNWTLKFTFSHE
jgi:hypothetical protein